MAFTCIEIRKYAVRVWGRSEQEVKEAVKPTGNNYTWEELAKYNERHNVYVAVRGKVSQITLSSDYIRF